MPSFFFEPPIRDRTAGPLVHSNLSAIGVLQKGDFTANREARGVQTAGNANALRKTIGR